MKNQTTIKLCFLILFLTSYSCKPTTENDRETVLDGIVHIEPEIIYDVPEVDRWCDRLGFEGMRVNIGDCELYVEIEGYGIPMVLVNGGPGGTHHYFHPHFTRAAGFAEVIYYDQRGCGLSDYEPGDGYTIHQAADDLDNLRHALDIDQWVVVGYSYGGLLAQLYATEFPENLAGLVLVSSALGMPVELKPTRQYDYISDKERERMQEINEMPGFTREQRIFNRYLNGDWKRQNFYRPGKERIADLARYEWIHDSEFRTGIIESMRGLDLEGAFNRFPIPTLIIEGKWDLTWNTDKPEVFRSNHPNAEMILFERSGHSPFADEPEKFFRELQRFVESLTDISEEKIAVWKEYLDEWRVEVAKRAMSLNYMLRTSGWGKKSSERISQAVTLDALTELASPVQFLRVGFAFYDVGEYQKALATFKEMENVIENISGENRDHELSTCLIWQGHMLDLLGRRQEAIKAYERVIKLGSKITMTHSQYNLTYEPVKYADERIRKPFDRLENIAHY